MKKILALVLALVMTMSLATISSGAAYSDADKVTYADAVNTMTALGIMGGYEDGTIRPQADVTRGAAAKMVAMVATASNANAIAYYAGTSSFADVPATHTFADAVAFCVARGIVEGYGNGLYGVADNVKGWAVAKMVLVAMGYDAEAYGLTGAGAALRTITLATQVGLFDGMADGFNATKAASREECAQIVYNALNQKTVVELTNSDGVVTYQVSGAALITKYGVTPAAATEEEPAETVIEALVRVAAVEIEANQANTLSDYTVAGSTNYNVETGADMIGHKVIMLQKGPVMVDANNISYINVYGVADLTVETEIYYGMTAAEVKAALVASGYSLPYGFDELEFDVKFTDGGKSEETLDVVYSENICKDGDTLGMVTLLGTKNEYGVTEPYGYRVADAMTTDMVAEVNTIANTETITMASGLVLQNNIVLDEVNEYEGIAVGDFVTYTVVDGCYNLVKCTTVTGTVTRKEATTGANAYQLTVNGQVLYGFWGTNNGRLSVSGDVAYSYDFVLGAEYTFYLASDGSYFAAVPVVEYSDYVYVAGTYDVVKTDDYGTMTVYTYAQCVALDGSISNVLVGVDEYVEVELTEEEEEEEEETLIGVASLEPGFYSFSLISDPVGALMGIMTATSAPDEYDMYTAPVVDDTSADAYEYADITKNGYISMTNNGKAYITANTKFIFLAGEKALLETKVVTGSVNTNITSAAQALVEMDANGNFVVKAIIAATDSVSAGTAAIDYLYVADTKTNPAQVSTVTVDGVVLPVYEYTVYEAATGVKKTINATNEYLVAGFYGYSEIAEGVLTLGDKVTEAVSGAGAYYGEAFKSMFGTKITTSELSDVDTSKAIVVDTRTAKELAASKVAKLSTVAAINAAKLAVDSHVASFDCYVSVESGVTVIFVYDVASASAPANGLRDILTNGAAAIGSKAEIAEVYAEKTDLVDNLVAGAHLAIGFDLEENAESIVLTIKSGTNVVVTDSASEVEAGDGYVWILPLDSKSMPGAEYVDDYWTAGETNGLNAGTYTFELKVVGASTPIASGTLVR